MTDKPAPDVVEALRKIALENCTYTTGEGHQRCIEIARAALGADQ